LGGSGGYVSGNRSVVVGGAGGGATAKNAVTLGGTGVHAGVDYEIASA